MSDEDTYDVPLTEQRVFGAGLKRKRVQFVPSSSESAAKPPSTVPAKSVSDIYLSLVLPNDSPSNEPASPITSTSIQEVGTRLCEICNLPFEIPTNSPSAINDGLQQSRSAHESLLAHQVCMPHSHPPSHLDRNRKGLAMMSAHGWDLDARVGLGALGREGRQFPIKPKEKNNKHGIGLVVPKGVKLKEKTQKLDAGKVRKLGVEDRRKTERLREMFYSSEDVARYLGGV